VIDGASETTRDGICFIVTLLPRASIIVSGYFFVIVAVVVIISVCVKVLVEVKVVVTVYAVTVVRIVVIVYFLVSTIVLVTVVVIVVGFSKLAYERVPAIINKTIIKPIAI